MGQQPTGTGPASRRGPGVPSGHPPSAPRVSQEPPAVQPPPVPLSSVRPAPVRQFIAGHPQSAPQAAGEPPSVPLSSVRPAPVRQFILKTHSRCNLACTYCYVYAGPDQSWRERPAVPSAAVVRRTAARIAEHAAAHALPEVAVVLHGGEPLLRAAGRLAEDVAVLRAALPRGCALRAGVQTNATLLTRDRLRTLRDAGLRIGVSLDGGLPGHNRARVDHAGRPSWPAAAAGLRLLAETAPEAYAGLLCVVDLAHDPVEVYESLLAFRPPVIDLLLPHGNWTSPPPGLPASPDDPAPYGRWLTAVFDRWWDADRRRTRVRLFEECVALLLGVPAAGERLGLHPFTSVVVETDGAIEQVDSLKSAYEGAAATGLDVFRNSFDDALAHPGIAARQAGLAALGATCRACSLVRVCGGGHYVHRYRAPDGFRNPSVYCADLAHLIHHVHTRLTEAASPDLRVGVGTGRPPGAGTDSGSGVGPGSGVGTGPGAGVGTGRPRGVGTDSGSGSGVGPWSGVGTDPGAGVGTGRPPGAGTDPRGRAGTDSRPGARAEPAPPHGPMAAW